MKSITLTLMLLTLPLIGCASFFDYITPAKIPELAVEYTGQTNQPEKVFGLFNTKAQLDAVSDDVISTHKRNVFEFQQEADKENFEFEIVSGDVLKQVEIAAAFQRDTVVPAFNLGSSALTGLLGLGAGGMFIKRPGDKTKKEHDVEVKEAGLADPEEFKKKISAV